MSNALELKEFCGYLMMMGSRGSILFLDRDSLLVGILSSYVSSIGYRAIFTTRIREAIKKMRNQKFIHIFVDPDLRPDLIQSLFFELSEMQSLNYQTPLTIMTSKLDLEFTMDQIKNIKAIMQKPFSLREFNFRLTQIKT